MMNINITEEKISVINIELRAHELDAVYEMTEYNLEILGIIARNISDVRVYDTIRQFLTTLNQALRND